MTTPDEFPSAHPLTWPTFLPRCEQRQRSRFRGPTIAKATRRLSAELLRFGVADWQTVISSNILLRADGLPRSDTRNPADPGVAVYFRMDDEPHVLACDAWDLVADNLHAVALHVGALRALDRWRVGTAAQAFAGYKLLPETSEVPGWWQVLDLERGASIEDVRARYRQRARDTHPDRPDGNRLEFERIVEAFRQACAEKGGR